MKSTFALRFAMLFSVQLKEFKRDFGTVFLSFVFPFMFVVALVVTNLMDAQVKFKFAIVDPARNPHAQTFVDELTATPSVEATSMTREQATTEVVEGTLHAAIVLPAGDFRSGAEPLQVIVGSRYEAIAKVVLEATSARMAAAGGAQPMRFESSTPGEKVSSEFTFVFPGILAIALLQMALFATAVPLLQARERGTLRYLSLTPLSTMEMLASQVAFRYLIALLQISLLLVAGTVVLKLTPAIWLAVLGVACLGVLMLVSIGYAIAGAVSNLQVGMAVVMVAEFGMIFGGNVFWDTDSSSMLYWVAHFIPLSYLADMFRQVVTGMSGVWPLWVDALAMLGWTGLALLVATRTFRFDTTIAKAPRLANA